MFHFVWKVTLLLENTLVPYTQGRLVSLAIPFGIELFWKKWNNVIEGLKIM